MIGKRLNLCRARVLHFAVSWTLLTGCEKAPSPIDVFPAHGTVLGVNGNPVEGGVIEFRSKHDYRIRSVASVGGDGKFVLSTQLNNEKFDGAPQGDYEITFSPRGSGYIPSIELEEDVTIKPEENNLTIKLKQ
jgi:hypothetical protein